MDLRGLPMVILPGALYVTAVRAAAEHRHPLHAAVPGRAGRRGALEPLIYSPGPLQTADETSGARSSDEMLQLKVADIAMGSAAFLVAACRYLGDGLVEAWAREGDDRAPDACATTRCRRDAEEDPVVVEARRQIIEHCLYGVDINPMAVEMAKLSLWLVSMDPHRPFTFLDDRLVAGDSLLGVTSLEQVEYLCLDPKQAREWREGTLPWSADVRGAVAEATGGPAAADRDRAGRRPDRGAGAQAPAARRGRGGDRPAASLRRSRGGRGAGGEQEDGGFSGSAACGRSWARRSG